MPKRMKKINWIYLVLALAAIAAMLWLRPRTAPAHYITTAGEVWTTQYHITYETSRDLADSIVALLDEIDRSVSPYNKASRVSALNAGTTDSVDARIADLLATSRVVHEQSGRVFDPTVMPLVNAWGFGYKTGQMPTSSQIDSILQFVGLQRVHVTDGRLVKDDARVQLDFSSIAKGRACDEVLALLKRNGVTNALVEIGGEIAATGVNAQQLPWHVSVDMPVDQQDTTIHSSALVLNLDSGAVATSGNYRKFRELDGRKITHIVNPLTGRAEASNLLSVTVTAPTAMLADAWATACMAMGTDATQRLMESRTDLGVLTITAVGDQLIVWSNARFAHQVVTPQ